MLKTLNDIPLCDFIFLPVPNVDCFAVHCHTHTPVSLIPGIGRVDRLDRACSADRRH